jgi:hypothetical protein
MRSIYLEVTKRFRSTWYFLNVSECRCQYIKLQHMLSLLICSLIHMIKYQSASFHSILVFIISVSVVEYNNLLINNLLIEYFMCLQPMWKCWQNYTKILQSIIHIMIFNSNSICLQMNMRSTFFEQEFS